MRLNELNGDFTPKMSPYVNNLDMLVDKAGECAMDGKIDVMQAPISKILFTQDLDRPAENTSVEAFSEFKDLPFALLLDGFFNLLDGHHRVADAIKNGETTILMYVANGDNY